MTIKQNSPACAGLFCFCTPARQAGSYAEQQLFLNAYSSEVAAVVKDGRAAGANDSGQIVIGLGTGVIAKAVEADAEL